MTDEQSATASKRALSDNDELDVDYGLHSAVYHLLMVSADLSSTRHCLTAVCILPDLCFFVIVGVLLFDMVTGIIVDTFASCREETEHRSHALENTCFICDIDREKVSILGRTLRPLQLTSAILSCTD